MNLRFFALLLIAATLIGASLGAHADPVRIDSGVLTQEIDSHIRSVAEFDFIRREAEKRGVRVWLFGGTAAAFAHYVKWDRLSRDGDSRFQRDRFDYDFTNIYRSTQDLDIVVDGPADKIAELQTVLVKTYPHFVGDKNNKWELRSLRHTMGKPGEFGYKEALLDDFDFLNQDSDSQSTGLIEITTPAQGTSRIIDLKNPTLFSSVFLSDVANGRLTFYREPKHFETKRAKAGLNPEIFAATRALVKAFQFELEIPPDQFANLQSIVTAFDPNQIGDKNVRRLSDIAKKLVQNAVNIEYAIDTLEQIGLRNKLAAIGDKKKYDSMAWWLSRQPLPSFSVGHGSGATAAELKLDILSHETKSFLAYEAITRAHTGDANVLSSRQGIEGEAAVYGEGFYTMSGRKGGTGSGLTIRFQLNPEAREGYDFKRVKESGAVIVLNKAAIHVIPESLDLSLVDYYKALGQGELDPTNRALMDKLKLRLFREIRALNPQKLEAFTKYVEPLMKQIESDRTDEFHRWQIMRELLSPALPDSMKLRFYAELNKHPDIVVRVGEDGTREERAELADLFAHSFQWSSYKEYIQALLLDTNPDRLDPGTDANKFELLLTFGDRFHVAENYITPFLNNPDLMTKALRVYHLESVYMEAFLTHPEMRRNPRAIHEFVYRSLHGGGEGERARNEYRELAYRFVKLPDSTLYPDLLDEYFSDSGIIDAMFNQPHWRAYFAHANSSWLMKWLPASVLKKRWRNGKLVLAPAKGPRECFSLFGGVAPRAPQTQYK